MTSLFPRETHPEALFQKILSQPQAKARLYETFCAELENYTDTEGLVSRTMPYGLLRAYENQDLSAFLVGLCGNTMFDLLRAAFLIPNRFGGKEGDNPRLLTSEDGAVLPQVREAVSPRTLRKFSELRQDHTCVPRSALYLREASCGTSMTERGSPKKSVSPPGRESWLSMPCPTRPSWACPRPRLTASSSMPSTPFRTAAPPPWSSMARTPVISANGPTTSWASCCP